ncbi:bifunctional diguanylate cyclase/phosphodiesterase [Thalassospira sp. MCCC 1A01428]|uniref:sensor domain-containing protein n=1 Tax=Thalassospira sp. MCCC 1A01428 TaxID=1470575 RepID=UPI000A2462C2|nr:sensor domain-containing diguanylate cyclase [Thalassospira sp. MCCC 1A01428]OSQ41678.1 diguanylate cyclase [Thalassospira sp. MCCC 1A01428]
MAISSDIVATAALGRDGIIFLSANDLSVQHANNVATKMLEKLLPGLKTGTALKQFLALLSREANFTDSDGVEAVRKALQEIGKTGERDLPPFSVGDVRIFWRKTDGPADLVVLQLRDVTRSEALARALTDHKFFIQHLIDALPIPIYVKNIDGVINRCNSAFSDFIGCKLDAVLGRKSSEVTPAMLDATMNNKEKPLLVAEGNVRDEISFEREDGTAKAAIFAASTLKTPSGAIGGTIGSLIDITSLKKAEAEVAGAAARLTDILQKAPIGVGISDRETGKFLFFNKTFVELLGIETGDSQNVAEEDVDQKVPLTDATDSILLSERYREKSLFEMDAMGELHDVELRIRPTGAKEARWLRTSLEPLPFEGQEAVLWWVSDITKQKMASRELQNKANNDELTGLANRARFMQKLNHCESVLRGTETPAAVFLLDLDGFKQVNDTLGHAAGDWVLVETARRLVRVGRRADEVARLGGDEFTMVFVNKGRAAEMIKMADEILKALAEPYIWEGKTCPIGASIGISVFDGGFCDMSEQLRRADKAMYQAKLAGKGQYALYDADADIDLHDD